MAATGEHGQVSPPIGTDAEIKVEANNLFERLKARKFGRVQAVGLVMKTVRSISKFWTRFWTCGDILT